MTMADYRNLRAQRKNNVIVASEMASWGERQMNGEWRTDTEQMAKRPTSQDAVKLIEAIEACDTMTRKLWLLRQFVEAYHQARSLD